MAVGDDYKVSRRYRDEIEKMAAQWRAAIPSTEAANRFDVVQLLTEVVLPSLANQGCSIVLTIVEDDPFSPDAWVDFEKGELCFQEFIWSGALQQEPHSRLVLAHEMGHLLLHRDQLHAFSRGMTKKINFLDPEQSAEQQANWFAAALLLPEPVLRRLSDLDDSSVATLSLVGEQVVRVRRRDREMDKRHRSYTGDPCPECQSFSVMRIGISTKCDDCGAEIESS